MKQCIADFIERPWSKEEKCLVTVAATLLGILLGIFLSPIGGFHVLCNNGSNNGSDNKNNGNGNNEKPDNTQDEEEC